MPEITKPLCLLGVTGSIAAYKAVHLARLFLTQGWDVQVLMTRAATRFVGAATFSGLSGRPPLTSLFGGSGEPHVQFARSATIMVIAPCTADSLARLATGQGGDPVSATALCLRRPLLVAPAMHPNMWAAPGVQRNVQQLQLDGVAVIGPACGEVASGDTGLGRMVEPEAIYSAALALNVEPAPSLAGLTLVISAGPTVEDLDPVRFISNRSSGKMGFAVAAHAARAGAHVVLIAGPVTLPTPQGVHRVNIRSAAELEQALADAAPSADAVVMAAAVGDYRPAQVSETKLKRSGPVQLSLVANPDIIAGLGAARGTGKRPVLVAFAVETGTDDEIEARARHKLLSKQVDLVVANHAAESLGRDDNRVQLVERDGTQRLKQMPKTEIAKALVSWIQAHVPPRNTASRV